VRLQNPVFDALAFSPPRTLAEVHPLFKHISQRKINRQAGKTGQFYRINQRAEYSASTQKTSIQKL
jgi:hypothetical protein